MVSSRLIIGSTVVILLGMVLWLSMVNPSRVFAGIGALESQGGSVDIFLDPSTVDPAPGIKMRVVASGDPGVPVGAIPSGRGIEVDLALFNKGPGEIVIPAGTRLIAFENLDLNMELAEDLYINGASDTLNPSYTKINAYFDGGHLATEGLTDVTYSVDPDQLIDESDESNNQGEFKLFHPDAFPDLIITDVEVSPDPVEVWGKSAIYQVSVDVKNVGGDMTRWAYAQVDFRPASGYLGKESIPPLQSDESYKLVFQSSGKSDNKQGSFDFTVAIQEFLANHENTLENWAVVLNLYDTEHLLAEPPGNIVGGFTNYSSPLEIGSESHLIGFGWSTSFPYPLISEQEKSINNYYSGQIEFKAPVPHLLYPEDGQSLALGEWAPFRNDWQHCKCNNLHPKVSPPLGWPDSLLRFRWLPYSAPGTGPGNEYVFRLQITKDDEIIQDKIIQPIWTGTGTAGSFAGQTGIEIDEYQWVGTKNPGRHFEEIYAYFSGQDAFTEDVAMKQAQGGYFNQYVYDGPVLLPGTYTWRVTSDVNQNGGPTDWSPDRVFTLAPGEPDYYNSFASWGDNDLVTVNDEAPSNSGVVFSGQVKDTRPSGFTIRDESGFINLKTDALTYIDEQLVDDEDTLISGEKVHVLSMEAPYYSGRAYVPESQIPTASFIAESPEQSYHKRCTVVGGVVWPDGSTGKGLACEDGSYFPVIPGDMVGGIAESDLDIGTSTVVLVRVGKPPVLISTAKTLYERMKIFQDYAISQDDQQLASELSLYESQIGSGFEEGFQSSLSSAPPEIQQLLKTLDTLADKIKNLAEGFMSNQDYKVIDFRDIEMAATLLNDLSNSYEDIVDLTVFEVIGHLPLEVQMAAKANIESKDASFVPVMKQRLLEAVGLLEANELEEAMSKIIWLLDYEEEWMNDVAIPELALFLADEAVKFAKDELDEYGDQLSAESKENLQSKIDALESAIESNEKNLGGLIDALWAEIDGVWDSGDEQQLTLEEVLLKSQNMLSLAKSDLQEYGQSMSEDDKQNIEQKIFNLEQAEESNQVEIIQTAINELSIALDWDSYSSSGEDSDIYLQAKKLIELAHTELTQYSDVMSEGAALEIENAIDNLNDSLEGGDPESIEISMESLAGHLAEWSSSVGGPELNELVEEALNSINTAEGIINSGDSGLASAFITQLQSAVDELQDALKTEDAVSIKEKFKLLVSQLDSLKGYTPEIVPEIVIQCPSSVIFGNLLECSSQYDRVPDQITWSADSGSPSTGSGDWFQTYFDSPGVGNVSVEACIASACSVDSQQVSILPGQSPK
jgi:hypothetical protein